MKEEVRNKVYELLKEETSGHEIDHIERVYNLAIKFAKKEKANAEIVGLAALLHDVDDYKLVGISNADKFINAKRIMKEVNVSAEKQERIIEIIKNMGYSKSLKGIRPKTIEGMCVSDADMCDIIGAHGIIRAIMYHLSVKGNKIIFNRDIFPKNSFKEDYFSAGSKSAINHFFDKSLRLKGLMMTNAGKEEASTRHEFMISFLKEFFKEENAPEWLEFLENYLKNLK